MIGLVEDEGPAEAFADDDDAGTEGLEAEGVDAEVDEPEGALGVDVDVLVVEVRARGPE